jgi:hypothetical protein
MTDQVCDKDEKGQWEHHAEVPVQLNSLPKVAYRAAGCARRPKKSGFFIPEYLLSKVLA